MNAHGKVDPSRSLASFGMMRKMSLTEVWSAGIELYPFARVDVKLTRKCLGETVRMPTQCTAYY